MSRNKNRADLRFAVSSGDRSSGLWRLFVDRKGDLYLGSARGMDVQKISLHKSGVFRNAFTSQYAEKSQMQDRLIQRWMRPPVPDEGAGHAARLVWIAFPSDYLLWAGVNSPKAWERIPAAPTGMATFLEIALTKDSRSVIEAYCGPSMARKLLMYCSAYEEYSYFVSWYHAAWENEDMDVPESHGRPGYRFAANFPGIGCEGGRITLTPPVPDGDAMYIIELGGYKIATSDAEIEQRQGVAVFRREHIRAVGEE